MFTPSSIVNRLGHMVLGLTYDSTASSMYQPTPSDIVVARAMLSQALRLPPDVVDTIFDHAEYWAHSTNYIDYMEEHKSPLHIAGGGRSENKFLLRSLPVGFTRLDYRKGLAETLAYDMNETQPHPLGQEYQRSFFEKLAKYPTPRLIHPVRKVVFTTKSHDQGWTSNQVKSKGSYNPSWTWFEAGHERFDATQTCDPQCTSDIRYNSPRSPAPSLPLCALRPLQPTIERTGNDDFAHRYIHTLEPQPNWEIGRNKLAVRDWQERVVTWSWDDAVDPESDEAQRLDKEEGRGAGTASGEFVRSLKLGDVVTIWGKARFRGWVNMVEKVEVQVYWAV